MPCLPVARKDRRRRLGPRPRPRATRKTPRASVLDTEMLLKAARGNQADVDTTEHAPGAASPQPVRRSVIVREGMAPCATTGSN